MKRIPGIRKWVWELRLIRKILHKNVSRNFVIDISWNIFHGFSHFFHNFSSRFKLTFLQDFRIPEFPSIFFIGFLPELFTETQNHSRNFFRGSSCLSPSVYLQNPIEISKFKPPGIFLRGCCGIFRKISPLKWFFAIPDFFQKFFSGVLQEILRKFSAKYFPEVLSEFIFEFITDS